MMATKPMPHAIERLLFQLFTTMYISTHTHTHIYGFYICSVFLIKTRIKFVQIIIIFLNCFYHYVSSLIILVPGQYFTFIVCL